MTELAVGPATGSQLQTLAPSGHALRSSGKAWQLDSGHDLLTRCLTGNPCPLWPWTRVLAERNGSCRPHPSVLAPSFSRAMAEPPHGQCTIYFITSN